MHAVLVDSVDVASIQVHVRSTAHDTSRRPPTDFLSMLFAESENEVEGVGGSGRTCSAAICIGAKMLLKELVQSSGQYC